VGVSVQRHYRHPTNGQFENSVKVTVADAGTRAAQQHDGGATSLGDLDAFKILPQRTFIDDQAARTPVVLVEVARRAAHRGQDCRRINLHAGMGQELGDLATCS
jgi:hypothetical protein